MVLSYNLIVYATIILLGALITLFTFDNIQTVLLVSVLIIGVVYLVVLSMDRLTTLSVLTIREGFVAESAASASKYEWLGNDDLFDDFYASVFTKLTQNESLVQAETAI